MSSARAAGVAAARPHIARATQNLPAATPFVLDLGSLVDDILAAAEPGLPRPPRHYPSDELDTRYPLAVRHSGERVYAQIVTGEPGGVRLIVQREHGEGQEVVEAMEIEAAPDLLRGFLLAALAAVDHHEKTTI